MADTRYLNDVLLLLLAAIVCVPLFQRLRLGPVLGYLAAGALIGPSGLGLIAGIEGVRSLAELGVVFLLFTIGLELTFEKLRALGAATFLLGACQVTVTALVGAGITLALGYGGVAAVIVGGGLAMSSTAVVVPLLAGQGRLATAFGQCALAILLVQDLAVAPLLVLSDLLAENAVASGTDLALALGIAAAKAVAAVVAIGLAGRFALQPLFRMVAGARSPELFVGTALLVAIGTGWISEHAGLSLAFGAFLAGLLLAETEFRHQIAADIEPFRGLLLGLFFMTVGMSIDAEAAAAHGGAVVAVTAALLVGKAALLTLLARLFRRPLWEAARLGIVLSQGGEFAFVLFGMAAASGLIPGALAQILLAAVGLSLLLMPFLSIAEEHLGEWLDRRHLRHAPDEADVRIPDDGHVIIVGQGDVGRIVARMLKAHEIPYVSLDQSVAVVKALRKAGEPIYFGDATDTEVLRGLRGEHARAIVVACSDAGTAEGVAAICRHAFPDRLLVVRGSSEEVVAALRKLGVTCIVQEATETGLRLVGEAIGR